jgi:undecaprenyl-diphosphatase
VPRSAASARPSARRVLSWLLIGLVVLVLAAWAAGELWVASIGTAESDFMRTLAMGRSQGLIELARVVTWAGSLWLLVPLGLVFCFLLARAGLVVEAIALAVGLAGAIVIVDVTKALTARPRPPVEHLEKVGSSSFPSAHATQASAFWLSLVLALRAARMPKRIVVAAGMATVVVVAAVAWSRVYLGVHYPSDVVAGVVFGSAWALYASGCLYRKPARPGRAI